LLRVTGRLAPVFWDQKLSAGYLPVRAAPARGGPPSPLAPPRRIARETSQGSRAKPAGFSSAGVREAPSGARSASVARATCPATQVAVRCCHTHGRGHTPIGVCSMSDRITSVAESQDQSPESAVVAEVHASAEQAAQEGERLLREADSTCKQAVKAFRRGEQEYRKGLLEAGRLADLYVHQRMALKHPRENAIKTLEGEVSRFASSSVDVDRLVRCYHAYHLLAEEPGIKSDTVPYGHSPDPSSPLVEPPPNSP